ncbi:MAG: UDP-N-acetylmuramoyl-L-alanyl-D-glutamate--2,6-diaminopimelate ligase [Puniceicoccales bacterium]|jgi:UDP-N-acetylmuramoyl-L-alanyl-D-glutamate--2,6-diaminopimelate ligase|nr:UDP-N-acetylmuramoyl-L-alanyl-D-glutamate--2,6-diaminopimelate ligase [Puniceicoccales bacterium]
MKSDDYREFLEAITSNDAISGIADDSRKVEMGHLFFALFGNRHRGVNFISEAIKKGAKGIVVQREEVEEAENQLAELGINIAIYVVDDVRQALGLAARQFFQSESKRPFLFAVTGTNGKTTITYLLRHLLDRPTAVIGTIAYDLIDNVLPSSQTTPNGIALYTMLANLPQNAAVALEMSSHALAQKRVYGLKVDVGIFSNLTADHLDYHGHQEAYFLAKRKLFSGENGTKPKLNLLNGNDNYGQRLYTEFGGITYAFENPKNDYYATDLRCTTMGSTFCLHHGDESYDCHLGIIGVHNVENALAAVAAVHTMGNLTLKEIAAKLATFPGVPGRLQKIATAHGVQVFVDYAHTEDGLFRVLESLRRIKILKSKERSSRLITVFGCGGDRDRTKRAPMMSVACQFSDAVIATSDNPRHEKMEDIFHDMRAGMKEKISIPVIFETDRQQAIHQALTQAQENDIVLIAGKGHETYQQIGDEKIPFNDVDVVNQYR